jgi:hypothetical protein
MAKNKSPKNIGGGNSTSLTGPHFPSVHKFWRDYSNQEIRGMGFGNGKAARRKSWASTIIITTFVLLLVGGCIWINVIGVP